MTVLGLAVEIICHSWPLATETTLNLHILTLFIRVCLGSGT